MHAVQVLDWAEGPRYVTVPDAPAPAADQLRLRVVAAGAHQLVRMRAAGAHYSARELPHTLGVDCVAVDEADGDRPYYCLRLGPGAAATGSFAEYVTVARAAAHPLPPSDGVVDPRAFAAAVNPAMSGWMALTQRTTGTGDKPGFAVLVLGATTASGRLAARAARALGAARVVGVARNTKRLRRDVADGVLDEYVELRLHQQQRGEQGESGAVTEDKTDWAAALRGVDVILDYVYGAAAAGLLAALAAHPPPTPGVTGAVQYVQIGSVGGSSTAALPAAALRSCDLTVRGSGPGAWPVAALEGELPRLLAAMATWGPLPETRAVPMREVETVWGDEELVAGGERLVFVP
ncbi:hypothetical protein GGR56DRAFT_691445 [Xylariaceae sp. FL0804]|nr:hypothetical protein GGR56DRAFT_691445 [Xylariaceae sp. FL0804]